MVEFSDQEEEEYATAEEAADNFDAVPDGKYCFEVLDALTRMGGGKRWLTWKLKVRGGRFDGRKQERGSLLESKANFEHLKKDLNKCGIVLNRLSEINEKATQLRGLFFMGTVKTSGRYTNIFLDKVVEEPPTVDDAAPQSSGQPHDDETLPF